MIGLQQKQNKYSILFSIVIEWMEKHDHNQYRKLILEYVYNVKLKLSGLEERERVHEKGDHHLHKNHLFICMCVFLNVAFFCNNSSEFDCLNINIDAYIQFIKSILMQ